MGLTYHFKLRADSTESPEHIELFLKAVEEEAIRLGYNPTMVLNAKFDSAERLKFARRLTPGLCVEDSRLKGEVALREGQTWHHNHVDGTCRLIPERGVVLVITDERKSETILGFFKYRTFLFDVNGKAIFSRPDEWTFEDFLKTPDARLRRLVKQFAEAGYVESEQDDFTPSSAR